MLWKELNLNKLSILYVLLIVLTYIYLLYIIEKVCTYVITLECV